MCSLLSVALAIISGGIVALLVWLGVWLTFKPQRYLRFFAYTRMDVYRARGWTETEINHWTRGSLIQRLLGKPYSEWLKDVMERPESHKRALTLTRVGGAILLLSGAVLAVLWMGVMLYNLAACIR